MTDDKLPPWLSDDADDELDDNDLPDWLKNADDVPSTPSSSVKTGLTGELSWMQDLSTDDTPKGRASTGLTGELSWMQDLPTGDAPKERASTGLTGQLSWNQSDTPDFLDDAAEDDSDELPAWLTASEQAQDVQLPDWLDADELESEPITPQQFTMTDEMTIVDFLADDQTDDEQIPAWLMDTSSAPESPDVSAMDDMSTWGDWQGDTFTPSDAVEQASAFTDDSWLEQTEAPPLEEDFADLFSESAPITDFSSADLPTTGMLFGDEDFSLESEETFDLLSASGTSDIHDLLGGDEFDLLSELTEDQPRDEFDLLGELRDEPPTPIADSVANDQQFMAKYPSTDDSFDIDEEVDIDALLGGEQDPFREFDQPTTAEVLQDDLSWLDDISNVPFLDTDTQSEPLFQADMRQKLSAQLPQSQPEPEADVDEFLASLGDVSLDDITTSTSLEAVEDLDFDRLFEADEDVPIGVAGLSPDAPSWIADLSSVTAGENSAAAIIKTQKDRPAEDLPERMKALRERGFEIQAKAKTDDEVLSAIMPTSPVVMTDMTDSAIATVTLTAGQVQRAELLRAIVGNVLETGETSDKKRRAVQLPIERLFITLVLLLIILAPFFIQNLSIGTPPPPQFVAGSRQLAFFEMMNNLPAGAYILIAAEYGAMGAGELDIATESVLRHVLAQGATPVIISSDAVGLVRITNMMTRIADENQLVKNKDYVVVRYLVTDVVGLRDFSQNIDRYLTFDVDGNPTGLRIDTVNDFARVVVVTDSADNLRLWGEQILPLLTRPFVAVTSYSAAPLSEPYLNKRSGAYLTGYNDAFTYQTMVNRLLGGETIPIVTPTVIPTEPPTQIVTPITQIPAIIPPDRTPEPTSALELTPVVTSTIAVTESMTGLQTEMPTPTFQNTPTPSITPMPTDTPTPTFTPAPTATPIVQRFVVITASQPINIRPDPSTANPPVGVLRPDDRALILGEVTGVDLQIWYNITFRNNAGQTIFGWVRQDLVRVEEVIITPTPIVTPTATQSASNNKGDTRVFARALSPHRRQETTPESTPSPEVTAEATAELTSEVVIPPIFNTPTPQPTVEMRDEKIASRTIKPMDIADRQARWDSLALGILAAVVVIAAGNLFNLVRVIFRKRRR